MAVKIDDRSRAGAPHRFAPRPDAPERRPGDTLPPTPFDALRSTGGADLLVLSTDAQLIDTATRASREQLSVWDVSSWTELQTALGVTRRAVVLIDADLLGDATSARVAALDAYSHKVVVLVAAERVAAEGLMGLLSDRKIHRLLIKPAALGITRLLIDSAIGRCLRLAEAQAPEVAATDKHQAEPPRPPAQRRRATAPFWVVAAAGAALLAGVAAIASVSAWWRSSAPEDALASMAAAAPVEVALAALDATPAQGDELDDSSAPAPQPLDESRAGLGADAANAAPRQPLDSTVAALYADAERALLAGDERAAAAALEEVRRADPASSRLAFLEAQLERARAAAVPVPRPAVAEPPASASVAAASTELASLLTIARARIQSGQLLAPSGDSALEYVTRARRLAPQDSELAAARAELAAALVAAARSALESSDAARASTFTREAARLGADRQQIAHLESEAARLRAERAAQRHAEWLALAEARLRDGSLVAPPDDNARHYLALLQNEAPQHAGLGAAWATFTAALQQRIAAALAERDWVAAEERLAALTAAPNGAAVGEPFRAQLATLKLEEHYLAVAAPAGELELLERASPVYPLEAARDGVEGWVDVEFVVDVTGRTRGVAVVAAEPKGRFEAAALAAVAKYRYRPFTHEGRPFARRLKLRMRFALE